MLKKLGISVDTGKGYRALANISEDGGQEVPHLHFHLFVRKNWQDGPIVLKVNRYYLEIKSINDLNEVNCPDQNLKIEIVDPPNIELNKFFYKNIEKIIDGLIG